MTGGWITVAGTLALATALAGELTMADDATAPKLAKATFAGGE